MMPNLLQYPIALIGALKAGLIVVNTNPLYTPREMHHQFVDSDVKAIVIAENFAANLQKILPETTIKTVILTSIGELLGTLKGKLVDTVIRKVKRLVPAFELPNAVTFSEALKQGRKFKLPEFANDPERVILHQYTGGTTGVSKGAMLTNRNIVANMLQIKAVISPTLCEREEVVLCPLPLYHIFAFTVNCLAMMSMGAHSILIVNPRDLKTVVKAFDKYPITLVTGVNTLFNALANYKPFRKLDFGTLKVSVAGGMALQKSVSDLWFTVTGNRISEGYGLTETSPAACINPIDGTGRTNSIGMPIPSTDMRIVDNEGNPLPVETRGEIQIKGPQVMTGYFNRPMETEQVLKDGWFSTGDIGIMGADGYFSIVDRKKDMINVSGFNVFPNEIESVIVSHPKVLEAAAIGVPHEKSGECVKAYIVKKDDSLTEDELIQFCRENLTGYKVPKEVVFRKDLPKTNVGKILRRKLKEENQS
jgi:long-chain acyl-CoA synthetase